MNLRKIVLYHLWEKDNSIHCSVFDVLTTLSKQPLFRTWATMDFGTDGFADEIQNIFQNWLTGDPSLSLHVPFHSALLVKTGGHQGSLHSCWAHLFLILNPETCLEQQNDSKVHCQYRMATMPPFNLLSIHNQALTMLWERDVVLDKGLKVLPMGHHILDSFLPKPEVTPWVTL